MLLGIGGEEIVNIDLADLPRARSHKMFNRAKHDFMEALGKIIRSERVTRI